MKLKTIVMLLTLIITTITPSLRVDAQCMPGIQSDTQRTLPAAKVGKEYKATIVIKQYSCGEPYYLAQVKPQWLSDSSSEKRTSYGWETTITITGRPEKKDAGSATVFIGYGKKTEGKITQNIEFTLNVNH